MILRVISLLVFGSIASVAIAEDARYFTLEPLSMADFSEAQSSVLLDTAPNFIRDEAPPEDPTLTRFWKNNRIDGEATVSNLRLNFGSPSGDAKIEASIRFEENSVTIRSDKPLYKKFMGGVRIKPDKTKSWKFLHSGRGGLNLGIVVPKLKSDERVVMVCAMRGEIKGTPKPTISAHAEESLELQNVEAKVYARASAFVQSGAGLGFGAMRIMTSSNVWPAKVSADETLSKDPSVSLDYEADTTASIDNSLHDGVYGAGIKLEVVLQNSAELTRKSTLGDYLWVKRVSLADKLELKSETGDVSAKADECALIVKKHEIRHLYSREPLPTLKGQANEADLH